MSLYPYAPSRTETMGGAGALSGYGTAQIPQTATQCPPESPRADGLLDRMENHLAALQSIGLRLAAINERLFGPVPATATATASDKAVAMGSGMVDRLCAAQDVAASLASLIRQEIDRLERL